MPIPPLLIVPFLAYNLMALGLGGSGMGWNTPLVVLALPSGEAFRYTFGDALVLVALVLLIASPHLRPIKRTPLARAAMLAVPIAYAGEFLLVPAAATSIFFTCLVMSAVEGLMEWQRRNA